MGFHWTDPSICVIYFHTLIVFYILAPHSIKRHRFLEQNDNSTLIAVRAMNLNINAFLATSNIDLNTSLLAIYVIKHWFKTYMLNLMCSANTMLNKMEIHAKIFFKCHHTDFDPKFIDHFYTKPFFNLVILCVL